MICLMRRTRKRISDLQTLFKRVESIDNIFGWLYRLSPGEGVFAFT